MEERYDRAEEFVEVCKKAWASCEPDAVVMDRAAGIFTDAAKVHRIEHAGRFFRSRGPLNVVPSGYGGPAILQARTSPKGRPSPRATPRRSSPSSPPSRGRRRTTTT